MAVSEIAKITRPILTEVFPRRRLFEILDTTRKRPVIWVSGPPGSGKTTLVVSYLDAPGSLPLVPDRPRRRRPGYFLLLPGPGS